MSSVSYSVARGTIENTLVAGSQTVTVGTSAPATLDLSVNIDLTKGWTKREIKEAVDAIWRYLDDALYDTNIPL
jgi:hypothetical protein